jgi:hypothetical protein
MMTKPHSTGNTYIRLACVIGPPAKRILRVLFARIMCFSLLHEALQSEAKGSRRACGAGRWKSGSNEKRPNG